MFCMFSTLDGRLIYPRKTLIFIDESHKKRRDTRRRRGRAPLHTDAIMLVPGASGNAEPISSVTAISINDGYLGGAVFDVAADGNIDTETFLTALEEEILPRTNRYNPMNPPENSVFVFDNARTHDKLRIVLLSERFGVKCIFLPPYSYDLSPIELFFNTARSKLQRNSAGNIHSLKIQWESALQNSSSVDDCIQYYEKCFLFE